ncbi:Mechanosensitive ion channel [Cyclobacterium xiamenense]|uniref:Mechanosensitive ion channel n=1 Tax=Cyclobacterium xiamenense TaxID=1297121 RepID=A0A1H6X2L3_9BACT|nr:mechanosensitive ion channel domain-containing protein [Cyclobacterium xiamenense]SEJ20827.1 Mechanosensitive ion channel [Cyclobacterium xiamenense]
MRPNFPSSTTCAKKGIPYLFIGTVWLLFMAFMPTTNAQNSSQLFDLLPKAASDTVTLADSSVRKPISIEQRIQQNQQFLNTVQEIKAGLMKAPDTAFMQNQIPVIELVLQRIREQSLAEQSTVNLRFLNELENLIIGYNQQVNKWQQQIDTKAIDFIELGKKLNRIQEFLDQEKSLVVTDGLQAYFEQKEILQQRFSSVDSMYATKRMAGLRIQTQLSGVKIQLNELLESVRSRQTSFRRDLLKRDSPYLWQSHAITSEKPFSQVIEETLILNRVILRHYLETKYGWLMLVVVIFIMVYFGIRNMIGKIYRTKDFSNLILDRSKYLRYSPFLGAALILLAIGPYLFSFPPYLLILSFLFGSILVTTFLIRIVLDRQSMLLWYLMVVSFFVFGASNLITQLAQQEKWYLMGFSILGIGIGYRLLKLIKEKQELFPVNLPYLVYFFIGMQLLAVGCQIIGRFSLGKLLGIASTLSTMQGISLYVFVLVLMEAIYLQSELSKENQKDYANYLNYQAIYSRLKKIFSFLALLMWLYLLLVNFSVNQALADLVLAFLQETRTIGNTSFTYGSILVFFLLIWISSVLAKNIAYFASIRDSQNLQQRNKRLGSSILLIRLAILTLGFFLAVTASGLSLDKLAIVLGALSVGIGFGLQTIVNNLVSGIILAFERPIQIGDVIEVGGRSGIVKDVGIRSSTLQAYDGSEVIIPNGDLLSQHLVNWTLSDKSRRVELLVGVAYGSDLEKVHAIIEKIIAQDGILSFPVPNILVHNFGDSAVEFRILFWVANFDQWLQVKNKVLREIYLAFARENIEIPFPQRDVHLKHKEVTKHPPASELE